MKNKIFAILILTLLSLPVSVWAVDDYIIPATQEETAQTEFAETPLQEENAIQPVEEPAPSSPYKQPVSKKKIVKKFLAAMFGVIISSLTIYIGLSLYNKVREGFANEVHTPEGETPLNTPEKMEDAVKTFLDKTKWEG